MSRYVSFLSLMCLMLIWIVLPSHATTTCLYKFNTGSGNTYLGYCLTENGNILNIQTPSGQNMLGANGEGYGICNESPAQNYTDYGVSDTGNWGNAVVLSHSSTSVKIARTTADGHWTLTQTITMVPTTSSINVVMALKNNQLALHILSASSMQSLFLGLTRADSKIYGSEARTAPWHRRSSRIPITGCSSPTWASHHFRSSKATHKALTPAPMPVLLPLTSTPTIHTATEALTKERATTTARPDR